MYICVIYKYTMIFPPFFVFPPRVVMCPANAMPREKETVKKKKRQSGYVESSRIESSRGVLYMHPAMRHTKGSRSATEMPERREKEGLPIDHVVEQSHIVHHHP